MYIVIVGAGGIGKRLTEIALKDGNHNVIVIDKDQALAYTKDDPNNSKYYVIVAKNDKQKYSKCNDAQMFYKT